MNFQPRPYQAQIISHLKNCTNAFVLAQMGSGKTASLLASLKELNNPTPKRVLIIAPLRVAKFTWPDEIRKWDNFSKYRFAVAVGSPKARLGALMSSANIVIINTENVVWLVENWASQWDFDTIVVDESSAFKSPTSKRFKALKKVRDSGRVKRWILMTATPTPNSLLEAWPQMYLLGAGASLGTSFYKFKNNYFTSDYMGYKWTPTTHGEKHIKNIIKHHAVVVENYSGLPDKVDLTEVVDMPPSAMNIYEQLAESFVTEDITAANAAVLAGKLLQVASGAVYDDTGEWQDVHQRKMDALQSLVEQAEGENILIAYNYQHELERIKEVYPDAVLIKDKDAISRWNKGEIKMLIAHPRSAAHGLNLQDGGRRIIWFSPTWSNELKMQFDARLHRQGQKDHVFIHTIVSRGTIDFDVLEVLAGKKSLQDSVLAAVKKQK